MTSPFSSSRGFSFLSVIFLLLIMSVTVTIGYMAAPPVIRENKSALTIKRMEALREAALRFRAHNGGAPTQLDHLATTNGAPCAIDTDTSSPTYKSFTGWCGPYLDRDVGGNVYRTDGWGTPFQYAAPTVTSCGPNLTCGDGDDIVQAL
jgi:type II secretory pathway pseudopilin PulG